MILGISIVLCLTLIGGCASKIASEDPVQKTLQGESGSANIVSVSTSGEQNSYQFSVGIQSPDVDCNKYASWWEIITPQGTLIYRRILTHSHPTEQPFIRSGGPVQIGLSEKVIVRAYMHPAGYGGTVYQGSVDAGFQAIQLSGDFAGGLSEENPLPTVCTS